jgi:hypothetical protein
MKITLLGRRSCFTGWTVVSFLFSFLFLFANVMGFTNTQPQDLIPVSRFGAQIGRMTPLFFFFFLLWILFAVASIEHELGQMW